MPPREGLPVSLLHGLCPRLLVPQLHEVTDFDPAPRVSGRFLEAPNPGTGYTAAYPLV